MSSEDEYDLTDDASLNKARLVEQPSLASTMSYQFGDERMVMAQKGLLQRQSLEDSCLSGEGEDLSQSGRLMILLFSFLTTSIY